jgi:Xaa-Pro aminopeptidase
LQAVPSREEIHRSRFKRLRFRFAQLRCDALLVTHLPNVFYLCGFTGSSGVLLVEADQAILFTDSRYSIQARQEVVGAKVRIERRSPLLCAVEWLSDSRRKLRIAYPPERVTALQAVQLRRTAGPKVRWVEGANIVESLRSVKDALEISLIREAALLAGNLFEGLLPLVKPGVKELDLSAEVEYRLRRQGASAAAFETIIASGSRAALPHARASAKPLQKNELVVFDLGAILRGYCSDITRTVYVGRAPARVRRWYAAVLQAQEAARAAMKPGVEADAIDRAARRTLRRHRLAKYFTHSTGHGLGIEVHEAPRLARGERTQLQVGNIVTIEPGVYLEGIGGIRIEDDIALFPQGVEILSQLKRDLIEL